MDPIAPDPNETRPSLSSATANGSGSCASAPDPAAHRSPPAADPRLALLAATSGDLDTLERMLLAWAVHPDGVGFRSARLLCWSPVRAALVGRLWWESGSDAGDLNAALALARSAMAEGPDPGRTRELGHVAVAPEQLAGVAGAAWLNGGVAVGAQVSARGELGDQGALVLERAGQAIAVLAGDWDGPGESGARFAALESLRALATAALDAQAVREALARRERQHAALAEFAKALTSPLNLREVLDLACRLAVQTTGARGGAAWIGVEPEPLVLRTTRGAPATRERIARALAPLAARAVEQGRVVALDQVAEEPRLGPEVAAMVRCVAVLPLMAYGHAAGALAIYDRAAAHPADAALFDTADLAFMAALADLLALARDQAQRCDAVRHAEARQRELQQQVARSERLAELGEQAARVAQEVRNPLASISAFARRVHRDLSPDDPHRDHLEIVVREAERLERVVGEQLQYATVPPPRLKLENLNRVVQEALKADGERLVRRRVRLLKKIDHNMPALLLDVERMRRVVANVLDQALESVAVGGRIRVESRLSGSNAIVDIASDGPHQPGELMELLFVPFALSRRGGPGVGLALAHQVLKEHGGELRVRSEGEWSRVFSITVPVPQNQDRRHPGLGRRRARADRREHQAAE